MSQNVMKITDKGTGSVYAVNVIADEIVKISRGRQDPSDNDKGTVVPPSSIKGKRLLRFAKDGTLNRRFRDASAPAPEKKKKSGKKGKGIGRPKR